MVGLVFAYLVRFLAVSSQTLEAGLVKITPSLDMAARSLGTSPGGVLRRIHLPLLRGSLGCAAILVFVDVMKEMPATLLLRPFGYDTLAVRIWQLTSESFLGSSSSASVNHRGRWYSPRPVAHPTATTGAHEECRQRKRCAMRLLSLEQLTKSYPAQPLPAVDRLSLELERGEILALLGPSGCGKTTTLRLIAGFERPDAGVVEIGGKIMADGHMFVPPEQRGVGVVFQEYTLFPHLTVEENVLFGLRHLTVQKRLQRRREMLDMVGLGPLPSATPMNSLAANSSVWHSPGP